MSCEFTVLASGSAGNAAYLSVPQFGLMIDCGIGPRAISDRLSAAQAKWHDVSAVILTHTHTDHWKSLTLQRLHRERIPLILHERQAQFLAEAAPEFPMLERAGLIRTYRENEVFEFVPGLSCLPIRVPHDCEPTFAFRIDFQNSESRQGWSLGYASDLGHVPETLKSAFEQIDLLALEFNHDVELQRRSHRPKELINRVLGNLGHLSNLQAVDYAGSFHSGNRSPLQAIVQLHLSRECNTPELARQAVAEQLGPSAPALVTARQDCPTKPIPIAYRSGFQRSRSVRKMGVSVQQVLPGLD